MFNLITSTLSTYQRVERVVCTILYFSLNRFHCLAL
nr:MAG TPA: hypothetical protein [Caudoviricetes sp.]